MGDGLVVSGGGSMRVSTEEMTVHAAALRGFGGRVESMRMRILQLQWASSWPVLTMTGAPPSAHAAAGAIDTGHDLLVAASVQSGLIASTLDLAAEAYGLTEQMTQAALTRLYADVAYALGRVYPVIVAWGTPIAGGGIVGWSLTTPESRAAAADAVTEFGRTALSDPRVVDFVRYSVMSVDELGAGAAGVPKQILPILGEETLGILGLSTSAAVVGGLAARAGVMRETPVTVERGATAATAAPTGAAERVERIPTGDAQIRIERFSVPGEPDRFEVYIGGTREGGIGPGHEPFDMTSNVGAIAMGDPGSLRAVEAAMRDAGITAENPVHFAGYSQGAAIAVLAASTGEWNASGILTVGGPTGQLPSPDGVPHLAIEHDDDMVTALGGTHADRDRVVASRRLFPEGGVPDTSSLPAHELARYQETAALVDASADVRVIEVLEQTTGSGAGQVSEWTARRVTDEVRSP